MDYSHAACGGTGAQSRISTWQICDGAERECGSVDIQFYANPWNRVSSSKLLVLCAFVN